MDLSVIPECYIDTNLIETLVPPQKQYNHQKGCGTVTKVMKEKFADSFAIGIIDKDKKEVDYLKEFTEVAKSDGLILHKHELKDHYIIQIVPGMERFIFKCLAECDITPEDFELPGDLELFRKESKTTNSKDDDRFRRLFKALRNAQAVDIIRLLNLITYLKYKNYTASTMELQAILS